MKHAIITGGSSGIGLEIARLLLARGHCVSLLARRADVLETAREELAEGGAVERSRIHIAAVDVADETALIAAIQAAEAVHGPCALLVAAAGRVDPAFFDAQAANVFAAQIGVNLLGCVHAVRAVYPGMKARRQGKIMLVSSGAAQIGLPAYAAYCASKAGLKGFAEALRAEARPFGVSVSICYPPDTRTPQYELEMLARPPEAERIMGVLEPWPARSVAGRIMKGLDRGAAEVHFGFALTMLALFGAFIKPVIYWRAALGGKETGSGMQ